MIILTVALHVKVSDSIVEVSVCYCVCITSNFTNMGEKLPGGAAYTPPHPPSQDLMFIRIQWLTCPRLMVADELLRERVEEWCNILKKVISYIVAGK